MHTVLYAGEDSTGAAMISRVTLFSLLLGLLLASGIRLWCDGHPDACTRYLAGDTAAQKSEWVVSGTRIIEVPCDEWFMRMPLKMQILFMLDAALGVVFVLNALSDTREWLQMRRMRGMR